MTPEIFIYKQVEEAKRQGKKLLAILLDPDKVAAEQFTATASAINESPATHVLIGGSRVANGQTDALVKFMRDNVDLPIVLFPGHPSQISNHAHGILLLSLVSGRNPDFLIGHLVTAAKTLAESNLEIIPTGYLLIESGSESAVERVTGTKPLSVEDEVVDTAIASELLGHKLVYLEAGSGASRPVDTELIRKVASSLSIPLIVGGGIRSARGIEAAHNAGATMVVIGTAFEENIDFFKSEVPILRLASPDSDQVQNSVVNRGVNS